MYKADFPPSLGTKHDDEVLFKNQREMYTLMKGKGSYIGLTPIFYDKQTMNTFMLSGLFNFFPWLMNLRKFIVNTRE